MADAWPGTPCSTICKSSGPLARTSDPSVGSFPLGHTDSGEMAVVLSTESPSATWKRGCLGPQPTAEMLVSARSRVCDQRGKHSVHPVGHLVTNPQPPPHSPGKTLRRSFPGQPWSGGCVHLTCDVSRGNHFITVTIAASLKRALLGRDMAFRGGTWSERASSSPWYVSLPGACVLFTRFYLQVFYLPSPLTLTSCVFTGAGHGS